MKELQPRIVDGTATVQDERPVMRHVFIGKLLPRPGHRCYELNLATGQMEEVVMTEVNAVMKSTDSGMSIVKNVIMKPGCIYTTALNGKNAFKHFLKMLQQTQTPNEPN